MGKKSGPAAPAAPDPTLTAQAQTQMNKDSAVAQANLNRIDQYTPQGSLTYQQIGTNADGTPKYQQTQSYSAPEQQKYDQQNSVDIALNQLAQQNINRVQGVQSQPFSFNGMTDLRTQTGQGLPFGIKAGPTGAYGTQNSISDPGAVQKSIGFGDLTSNAAKVAQARLGELTSRLDPQYQQQESDMRSRLAAQGISENSDAYRRELDNFSRAKNDAYGQANLDATISGANEQSRLFGIQQAQGQFANQAQDQSYQQALGIADLYNSANQQQFSQDQSAAGFNNTAQNQAYNQDASNAAFQNNARQQQISEASYLRNLPLNEIAALMGTGGSVNDPSFQSFGQVGVAAPDYQGLVSNNYNSAMQQYQQAQANRSSMLGSIFGTVGKIGGAIAMSDRRLKHGVQRVGRLPSGIRTYRFKYRGSSDIHFGVMAQEVRRVRPEAIIYRPDGYMMVDYGKVYA